VIDLHCHSTASDGLLSPADVVAAAAAAGLMAVALTDHDTLAGLPEARVTAARLGVELIGGCEFSVGVTWGEMHLLAYFLEPGTVAVEAALADARADRSRRASAMVTQLSRLGVPLTLDDVRTEANGGAMGRPHVARALHRRGHVPSVQAAFDRYIGRGRPAFVEKELPAFSAIAELVHRCGGIVSAAHLKGYGTRNNLERLKHEGLDAVETRHPSHHGDTLATITEAALSLDLARTGGSDWHGETDPSGTHATLGSQHVPDEWLVALRARAAARAGNG
jgi:hypothetical protein